jgi:hypothetical protein
MKSYTISPQITVHADNDYCSVSVSIPGYGEIVDDTPYKTTLQAFQAGMTILMTHSTELRNAACDQEERRNPTIV